MHIIVIYDDRQAVSTPISLVFLIYTGDDFFAKATLIVLKPINPQLKPISFYQTLVALGAIGTFPFYVINVAHVGKFDAGCYGLVARSD